MSLIPRKKRDYMVKIGTDEQGQSLMIPGRARDAHLHAIGRTRSGKSRFLADLIIQDIEQGQGVCVIDPHGELCEYLVGWLAQRSQSLIRENTRVHLFDPKSRDHVFCLNPLKAGDPEQAFGIANLAAKALARVYGGDPTQTPLISATLNLIFVILATRGLPLAAAQVFLTKELEDVRAKLVAEHPDWFYRILGEELGTMSSIDFLATVESTSRRLRPFLGNPYLRRIFSQTENTVNLQTAMDRGDVILCDLSNKRMLIGSEELRALGIMLTSLVYGTATSRPVRPAPRPFHLYIDEVQNYVSDDIEDMLSQSSKFGLYLTLSHQHMGQIMENPKVYNAIMSGTLLKSVFSLTHKEALVFVDEIFADQVDPEKRKESLKDFQLTGHQVVRRASGSESQAATTGQAIAQSRAEGATTATSSTEASGYSEASGTMEGLVSSSGEAFSQMLDGLDEPHMMLSSDGSATSSAFSEVSGVSSMSAQSETYARSEIAARSQSGSFAKGSGQTSGWSEQLEGIYEWLPNQTYTIEEQRYLLARQISQSKPRQGYFAAIGRGTVAFQTNDRPDLPLLPESEAAVVAGAAERSEWTIPQEEASRAELSLLEDLSIASPAPVFDEAMADPFLHVPKPAAGEDDGD